MDKDSIIALLLIVVLASIGYILGFEDGKKEMYLCNKSGEAMYRTDIKWYILSSDCNQGFYDPESNRCIDSVNILTNKGGKLLIRKL